MEELKNSLEQKINNLKNEIEIGEKYFKDELFNTFEIPQNISYIGYKAFYDCKNLTEIVIPSNIVFIGESAFENCENLTRIVFKEDSLLSVIENRAFAFCKNLKEIVFEDSMFSLHKIGTEIFEGDEEILFNESQNVKYIESATNKYFIAYKALCDNKECTLNPETEIVFSDCFSKIRSIEELKFYSKVRVFGENSFADCDNLSSVLYTGNITSWLKINFNEILSTPLAYGGQIKFSPYGDLYKVVDEITVPVWVREIKPFAFYGFKDVKSVYIPKGIEFVGNYAFSNMTSLTDIELSDTILQIGIESFSSCTSLKEIILPTGLITIPYHAFMNCTALEKITLPKTLYTICTKAFEGSINIEKIVFDGTKECLKNIIVEPENGELENADIIFRKE